MKIIILFVLIFSSALTFAADLPSLSALFSKNIDSFYQHRMCGLNITRLVTEATKRNIDLSNSYVLKIEGSGFFETTGFYTRGAVNNRGMLGYFHFVLVADGYVFDFDLAEILILEIEDYVRLQFTPPYDPFIVYGMTLNPRKYLPEWKVSKIEIESFLSSNPQKSWAGQMSELIDIEEVMKRERIR